MSKISDHKLHDALSKYFINQISKYNLEIEFNKKDSVISITTEHDMRLTAIIDAIHSRMIKQGLDPRSLDESKEHYS